MCIWHTSGPPLRLIEYTHVHVHVSCLSGTFKIRCQIFVLTQSSVQVYVLNSNYSSYMILYIHGCTCTVCMSDNALYMHTMPIQCIVAINELCNGTGLAVTHIYCKVTDYEKEMAGLHVSALSVC